MQLKPKRCPGGDAPCCVPCVAHRRDPQRARTCVLVAQLSPTCPRGVRPPSGTRLGSGSVWQQAAKPAGAAMAARSATPVRLHVAAASSISAGVSVFVAAAHCAHGAACAHVVSLTSAALLSAPPHADAGGSHRRGFALHAGESKANLDARQRRVRFSQLALDGGKPVLCCAQLNGRLNALAAVCSLHRCSIQRQLLDTPPRAAKLCFEACDMLTVRCSSARFGRLCVGGSRRG